MKYEGIEMPLTRDNQFHLKEFAVLCAQQLLDYEEYTPSNNKIMLALHFIEHASDYLHERFAELAISHPLHDLIIAYRHPTCFSTLDLNPLEFEEVRFLLVRHFYQEMTELAPNYIHEWTPARLSLIAQFHRLPEKIVITDPEQLLNAWLAMIKRLDTLLKSTTTVSILILSMTILHYLLYGTRDSTFHHFIFKRIEPVFETLLLLHQLVHNVNVAALLPLATPQVSVILSQYGLFTFAQRGRIATLPAQLALELPAPAQSNHP